MEIFTNRIKTVVALVGILCITNGYVKGQQAAQYSQYMYNYFYVNPGVAGTGEYSPLMFTFRDQWAGFPGAPVTYTLSSHSPITDKMGVGLMISSDKAGGITNTGVQAAYGYRIKPTEDSKISFGLSGTHNFTFTATNLCGTDTYNGQITVDVCTAINTVSNANLINIYPNPVTEVLNIKIPDSASLNPNSTSFEIYDVTGKLVMNIEDVLNNKINVSELNTGVYFYILKASNSIVTNGKIVKE